MKTISKPQEATFSMSHSSSKRKPPDDNYYADSLPHDDKRQRMFTEAHRFEVLSETHFSTAKKKSRADFRYSKSGSEQCERKMDRSTRLQCWTILKRLMIHPDGVAFKKPEYYHNSPISSDDCDDSSVTKEGPTMVGLEGIQWKLDKGMYLKADEFADEIRVMLSNVMLYGPKIRGIHRMAMKLREEFEKRWESMKERWANSSENNNGEKCPKVAPFSQGHKRVSYKLEPSKVAQMGKKEGLIALNDEHICPSFLGQSYCATQKEYKKVIYFNSKKTQMGNNIGNNTRSLYRPKSASELRKSDTDYSDCGSKKEFKKQNEFSKAHERAERIKKEREAARIALKEMKKTVEFGDDMEKYEELLELLYDQNPIRSWYLKSVGLYLKD